MVTVLRFSAFHSFAVFFKMASIDDSDVPETGAVFTFGRSRFADNLANKFWIRNDKIVHVACGDEHSIVVTERGRLYGFGANEWGQLGLGHTKSANKPSFIRALKGEKMTLAACGRTHSLVATESGKIFSFGAGGDGQLGHGDTEDSPYPKQIAGLPLESIKILSCGVYHSAVLYESGDLYIWGASGEGQTGQEEEELNTPTILSLDDKVSWVSCGYYHTALVTDGGKIYTCGENENGKLGLKEEQLSDTSRPQPVATKGGHFTAVACGSGHTLALNKDGQLFSFGDGSRGQLGQGTRVQELGEPSMIQQLSNTRVKAISCGDCHSSVITESGKLFTFGDGRHGKLGQGEECFSNQFRPVRVARFENFNVESVSCGGCHTLVTALVKEPGVSDDEDDEEGFLNASLLSTDTSMKEANTTLRPFSLANTIPMVSPRDKRRQKESENLANSFSGRIGNQKGLSLASLSLDRSRLPQIEKMNISKKAKEEEQMVPGDKTRSTTNEKVKKENKKNSEKNVDKLRRRIEDELNEDAVKSEETNLKPQSSKDKEPGKKQEESEEEEESGEEYESDEDEDDSEDRQEDKTVGKSGTKRETEEKSAKTPSKTVKEEDDEDEEEEEEEEESEYETDEEEEEEEEDKRTSDNSKIQKASEKTQETKKNIHAVAKKKGPEKVSAEAEKVKKGLKIKDEEDEEEEDEEDDDEDEEEEEGVEDEDLEDDEEEEDEEEEDEEEEEEEITETDKKLGKGKNEKETEETKTDMKKTEEGAKDVKEKVKNKKDKKKEKGKKANEGKEGEDEKDKDEEINNNNTRGENEENSSNSPAPKKSKFGNLFGKKKQQPPAKSDTDQTTEQNTESKPEETPDKKEEETTAQKKEEDEPNAPKEVSGTKKTGKSGVCTIL